MKGDKIKLVTDFILISKIRRHGDCNYEIKREKTVEKVLEKDCDRF